MEEVSTNELRTSVVGVDLGSSFTKISAVQKGVVDIITNQANLRQTSTVVGYGSKERLIGESGTLKMKSNLSNTIISPQRYLGISSQEYLKVEGRNAPSQLKHQGNERFFKVNCHGEDTKITPEQSVAAFFTHVQKTVELNHINNKFLTVAIPNYFTHQEKQALIDSLEISKRSCKHQFGIQLVNESTAVGLDYGFYKKTEFPEKEEEAKNIMFIDLGHSKLSLYVIKFTKNYQKVVYQNHLRQLGCKNFDELMLNFYSELFERSNPNLELSVSQSKRATIKLLENIEKQRKILSGNSEYDFQIDCLLEECDISYTMKREEFQSIIAPVMNQIKSFFAQVCDHLKESGVNLAAVQLIGGGSRIPIFIKTVAESFSMEPSRTLNSSECIARGAGLFSAMNSGLFRMQSYHSIEQSPQRIRCSWKEQGQQISSQAHETVVFIEHQPLYSVKEIEITLPEMKSNVLMFSINSNSILSNSCQPLVSFKLKLPENSSNIPRKVKILFESNINNMINRVSAYEMKESKVPLEVSQLKLYEHLSEAQLIAFANLQLEQILKDVKILEYYENRNKFESNLYEAKEKLTSSLKNKDLKEFINPKIHEALMQYFEDLQHKIDEISNFQKQHQEINSKVQSFFRTVEETKNSYFEIQKQLHKFREFIQNALNGKIKRIRYYPKEAVETAQQWIRQVESEQTNKNKYEQHTTSVQQINQKLKILNESIDKLQEEIARQQRQQKQPSYHQPQRKYEQKQYHDPYSYNPFGRTQKPKQYEPKPRGRGRNSSFNDYNSGFFSGLF